jgi:hypothetical protein
MPECVALLYKFHKRKRKNKSGKQKRIGNQIKPGIDPITKMYYCKWNSYYKKCPDIFKMILLVKPQL